MNVIELCDLNDFKFIYDSSILITQDNTLQSEETAHNMWCISMSDQLKKTVAIHDIVKCLQNIIDIRQKQIQQHSIMPPITFYLWFDEMACQLRFNVISGCNVSLPFRCEVLIVDSLQEIVRKFLTIEISQILVNRSDIPEGNDDFLLLVFVLCLQ